MPFLLSGYGVVGPLTSAEAKPLPPPPVLDVLPPSSNSPSGLPETTLPTLTPVPERNQREFDFQAPPQMTPIRSREANPFPATRNSRYQVYVNGNSPLLLQQVRKVEPEAFVRKSDGVIQAGVFSDKFNAQQRVRALEEQGIRAQIYSAAGEQWDESEPITNARNELTSFSYFVVVPGSLENLPDIVDRVVQLGIKRNSVRQREAPRGPHVAVGPFAERTQAERWSTYLRSYGMDARVYYDP